MNLRSRSEVPLDVEKTFLDGRLGEERSVGSYAPAVIVTQTAHRANEP